MNPADFKRCARCASTFLRSEFFRNRARHDGLAVYCKTCHGKISTSRTPREAYIAMRGASCAECGYDADIRALQVDHVISDGFAERARLRGHSPSSFYRSITRHFEAAPTEHAKRYQILCANCNAIKRHTHDEFSVTTRKERLAAVVDADLEKAVRDAMPGTGLRGVRRAPYTLNRQNKSGVMGVYEVKPRRWTVKVRGKYLGHFKDFDAACAVAREARAM